MKRETFMYEVYERWSLFSWDRCLFCRYEFRREKVYELMLHNSSVYSCSNCSTSKKNFIDKFAGITSVMPKQASITKKGK